MQRKAYCMAIVVCGIGLAGCGNLQGLDPGPFGAGRLAREVDNPGDKTKKEPADYPIDLPKFLVESVHVDSAYLIQAQQGDSKQPKALNGYERDSIEAARKYFYDNCQSSDRCAVLRDRVQDRLIWASESACSDYMNTVRRSFAATNLSLGATSTVFGTLGSLVTNSVGSRTFAGAAAIASGLRAEYNDVYFSSQAFELVSKSIRTVRERYLKSILDKRKSSLITGYTLEGAVSDAMKYHAACNVMAGLEEASDAVTRDRDPGLRRVNDLLQSVNASVTVDLGTSVLDTSSLPSAGTICQRAGDAIGDVESLKKKIDADADKMISDGTASDEAKAAAKSRKKAVEEPYVSLADIKTEINARCSTPDGEVAKAEKAMFESVMAFSRMPIADKPAGKAAFDKDRAAVQRLKLDVEGLLGRVRAVHASIQKVDAPNKP